MRTTRVGDFCLGEIFFNTRSKPTSAFVVMRLYRGKNGFPRVKGWVIEGIDGENSHMKDWGLYEMQKEFPFKRFSPPWER
jgi:hypothetical protein